jgi:predicted transcriptional regulator
MDDDPIPTDALEDVAYLSRSENRVRILDSLARGPSTRRGLADETGVSRTTLDRIVNELEGRGWAERTTGGDYAATPAGKHLVNQFRPFLESVAAIDRLGEAVGWLPTDEATVGLEHFRDATVMRPERDVVEVVEYMADLIRDSDEFLVLTHLTPPERLGRTLHESVVDGGLAVTGVMTGEALDLIGGEPRRRERWRETLEAGSTVYRHEGPIPCNLWVADDTVLIKKSGPEPIPESYGVPIVSDDPAVRSWARGLVEAYAAEGTRLGAADVDPEGEASRADPGG